jgi:hypothetical protein
MLEEAEGIFGMVEMGSGELDMDLDPTSPQLVAGTKGRMEIEN